LETFTLVRDRSYTSASLYWAGSAILGIISVQLGVILARLGN
ncbi:MAG: fluoride efflux transporter CrcB, partial [Coleofasciculus sp. C3-bin4]|nr:fluoride efflux transporter CrcB [Coleofasciculus sp. C3-bin4]